MSSRCCRSCCRRRHYRLPIAVSTLRGTALEYLEGVLPQDLSQRLWPFLGREQQAPRDVRQRDEILADLLRSNESIMLNLEELRKRVDKGA
jgi:hypothetical protein